MTGRTWRMMGNGDVPKCATLGCGNPAAEVISYRYRDSAETDHDQVCESCADGYSRRPVLVDFSRAPLPAWVAGE
jgi:hypothetical protein